MEGPIRDLSGLPVFCESLDGYLAVVAAIALALLAS